MMNAISIYLLACVVSLLVLAAYALGRSDEQMDDGSWREYE
jgi:hypothetical protein